MTSCQPSLISLLILPCKILPAATLQTNGAGPHFCLQHLGVIQIKLYLQLGHQIVELLFGASSRPCVANVAPMYFPCLPKALIKTIFFLRNFRKQCNECDLFCMWREVWKGAPFCDHSRIHQDVITHYFYYLQTALGHYICENTVSKSYKCIYVIRLDPNLSRWNAACGFPALPSHSSPSGYLKSHQGFGNSLEYLLIKCWVVTPEGIMTRFNMRWANKPLLVLVSEWCTYYLCLGPRNTSRNMDPNVVMITVVIVCVCKWVSESESEWEACLYISL